MYSMIKQFFILFFMVLLLVSCGGGSSSSSGFNISPVADAGVDQTVQALSTVVLDGSGSNDIDGSIVAYQWIQTTGSTVSLNNANAASASFAAPAVDTSTSLVFQLIVTDDGGGSATDLITITVESVAPGNASPVSEAGADQTVQALSTVVLDGSGSSDADGSIATYQWTQTTGSAVGLSNANAASASFTAPAVSASTSLVFQLAVTDDRGGTATDLVTITVEPVASGNASPVSEAGADQTVQALSTVVLDGSGSSDADGSIATYQWTQTTGSAVGLSNANAASASFTAPAVSASTNLVFQLVVTDDGGDTATDLVTITVTPSLVTIAGRISYDLVPQRTNVGGSAALDYNNISQQPVRGATVEALDSSGAVLATTVTDAAGEYAVSVEANVDVRIQAKAQLLRTGTPNWNVRVVDNTNSGALYTLIGSLSSSGSSDSSRNLNAASGWGGSSYSSIRAAGPFAILDSIYRSIQKSLAADANIAMSELVVNWSVNNTTAGGSLSSGQITTSFYSNGNLYILGDDNNDTDEYDGHIIIHEWGHYFEDRLSRSDSTGGSHSMAERLDMRLAFGEGFGNALSGIVTDDPFYRDTLGSNQGSGFNFSVESNAVTNPGWYNEASVQSILYDLYDGAGEAGVDTVALGYTPLYDVLVGAQRTTPAFTSIFSFIAALKAADSAQSAGIDTLLASQSIASISDIYGAGATNNGGTGNVLPVYTALVPGGGSVNICTITNHGLLNNLSNFRYLRMNITTTGSYTISAVRTSSSAATDPDFTVQRDGVVILRAQTGIVNSETASGITLAAGDYVLALSDYRQRAGATAAPSCFDVTIN